MAHSPKPPLNREMGPDFARIWLAVRVHWLCRSKNSPVLSAAGCLPVRDPLVNTQTAIENCHLQWIYPLKMVIFHSYVDVYQRVQDECFFRPIQSVVFFYQQVFGPSSSLLSMILWRCLCEIVFSCLQCDVFFADRTQADPSDIHNL